MIIPTILEGRFSELKHKVWFSSQFCTNYPAILTVQLLKKGRAFHTLEHKSMNHYIILFVALFLPIYSHEPVASTTSIDTLKWKANNIHFLWQYKFTVILLQIRLLVLDSNILMISVDVDTKHIVPNHKFRWEIINKLPCCSAFFRWMLYGLS